MELDISDPGNPWIFGKNTFHNGKFSIRLAHLYCVLVLKIDLATYRGKIVFY